MDAVCSLSGDGDREQILYTCHPHPLEPYSLVTNNPWSCDICGQVIIGEQFWGCQERGCCFYVHKPCLLSTQVASWSLYPESCGDEACVDCDRSLYLLLKFGRDNSSEYLCIRCCLVRKLIGDDEEESSSQVAKVIHHFFHPCALELTFSPSTTCNACFLNHNHLSYHCNDCDFFLDFECAQLPKVSHVDDSNNQIHHFCHWHPLQPFPEATDGETLCQLCESSSSSSSTTTSDPFYGCTPCQFYAHKSCIDILPQKFIHPILDDTVVLLPHLSYVCATCDRACSGLAFYSKAYKFCVACTLLCRNDFGVFKSIHHEHLLRTRETDEVDKSSCFLCEKDCCGQNYECKKCSTYFHKSCAELPRELQHPSHPYHPLSPTDFDSWPIRCGLCLGDVSGACYACSDCEFYLDFRCASLLSFIQYQGHRHLLCVVDNLSHDETLCNKCLGTLPKDSPVLRCADCDFNLHLECGPLPSRIKDPRHVHPLTFQEYYVEDNDMSDLFACHLCEDKREAKLPVYLCTDGCFMTCEVKCVLGEVVASLRGDRGVTELDAVYPKIACEMRNRDSYLKWLTCSSSRENVATDVPVFSWKKLLKSAKYVSDSDWESGLLREGYNIVDRGFSDLRLARAEATMMLIFTKHDGSSTGGDYMLPDALHSAYSNFFEEHNIFGPGCNLNHDNKRVIVFFICSILHDMRMTKVVDVSAERIAFWSAALKFVQVHYGYDGLELDILFKHITRLAEDHYLVRAVDIIEATFSELCSKKEELSTKKDRLIRELAETENSIEDNKEELKSFRAYRYAGARELKKEYYASLENKWRPCYEF